MAFSDREVGQFVQDGYVVLRGGFSPDVAAEARSVVWRRLGVPPDNPAAWRRSSIHLRESFTEDPFDRVMTPRLRAALDQIMGPGRATIHESFGWWPVLFPGFEGAHGWHVDGHDYHHHLTSPEQGLVPLFLFSDIAPGDGGTAMVRASHRTVARILARAEPAGLSYEQLLDALPAVDPRRVVELTGEAGDVAMLHPFLIHGSGRNTGATVRFLCNPRYSLKAPLQLDRTDDAYSPVEAAIKAALADEDRR
jgi:hypothetical protein